MIRPGLVQDLESVEDLAEIVREDPDLAKQIHTRPAETIAELAGPA